MMGDTDLIDYYRPVAMMKLARVAACLGLFAAGCLALPAQQSVAAARFGTTEVQQPLSMSNGGNVRLVDGGDAAPMQFPWQAALLTTAGKFYCGGSIIDRYWILTAGHCVDPLTEFKVVVGALALAEHESSMVTFTTTLRHLHPQFDMVFLDNDVGLLKLPDAMQFSVLMHAIALPTYSMAMEDLTGQRALVSGWGKTSDGSLVASPVLKFASLTILPNSECESIYGNTMIGNKLCLSAEDGQSVCQGDSGGALVVEAALGAPVQIGITSFVSNDGCSVRLPQGFTRVSAFLEFIGETTGIEIKN